MNFLESLEDATRPDVDRKPWFDEVEMALPGAFHLWAEMRRAIKAIPGMTVEDC